MKRNWYIQGLLEKMGPMYVSQERFSNVIYFPLRHSGLQKALVYPFNHNLGHSIIKHKAISTRNWIFCLFVWFVCLKANDNKHGSLNLVCSFSRELLAVNRERLTASAVKGSESLQRHIT